MLIFCVGGCYNRKKMIHFDFPDEQENSLDLLIKFGN